MASPVRAAIKTITWRIVGSTSTATIAWLITGSLNVATTIFVVQAVINTLLYFLHEILWDKFASTK
jgi:uncharacterized membrane protein